jgi:hypothetical protein
VRILLAIGTNFFAVGKGARTAPSDGPALRRTRRGGRPDGCARRSPSPRPGPDDHAEGQGLVVAPACRKAKDLGYPHELWTTRLLAHHGLLCLGPSSPDRALIDPRPEPPII